MIQFSIPTKKLCFVLLLFPLLFTACMDDSDDSIALEVVDTPTQQIQLAPQPAEWVTLQGKAATDVSLLEKKKGNRANNSGGNDRGRFNISLKFIVPATDEQVAVFEAAAGRWERIIIKDVPSITGTIPSAFGGFPPVVDDGTVDDIIIEVALAPIDGPGGILGQAGPRFTRTADNLPVSGVMFFDVADLNFLDQLDLFEDVIVHEMGHVLGVGTLWDFNRDLLQDPDTNPYFSGRKANVFWNAEGGTDELPVEDIGGPGTRLGHWRESVLGNELMTGFLNLGDNPLSRITAGSMRDLGYGAAMVGDSYDLPRGAPGVDPNAGGSGSSDAGLNIAEMEITLAPIGSITSN